MSSCLPEGAAHAPLKIEVRGSKPALRGIVPNHPPMVYFPMFWDAVVVGVTHDPHEVAIVAGPAMDMPNPQNEYASPYALVSGA